MTLLKSLLFMSFRSNYRFLFATTILLLASWNTQAVTFVVTNTNDAGAGSLRQAVINANRRVRADNINFDPALTGSTITLTSGEIEITDDLTISGPIVGDASSVTLDGNNSSRIFNASQFSNLTLQNLTLTHGSGLRIGGAVLASTLILNDCVVNGNKVVDDSGPSGPLDVFFNVMTGGGLHATNITLNRTTVSNNTVLDFSGTCACSAGGLFGSTITLNHSTVSRNTAINGGGIVGRRINLNQSTVSANTAIFSGGGITANGLSTFIQSTITNNIGGGVNFFPGSNETRTLTLINTILAGNIFVSGENLRTSSTSPPTVNARNSLFGDDPSEINGFNTSNIFDNSPDLGPLQFNGGPTRTHLPNASSPALDTGSNTDIPEVTDQRGLPRIYNGTVDIGSIERQPLTNDPIPNNPIPTNPIPVFSLTGLLVLIVSFTVLAGWKLGYRDRLKS